LPPRGSAQAAQTQRHVVKQKQVQLDTVPPELQQLMLAPEVRQVVPRNSLQFGIAAAGRTFPSQAVRARIPIRAKNMRDLFMVSPF